MRDTITGLARRARHMADALEERAELDAAALIRELRDALLESDAKRGPYVHPARVRPTGGRYHVTGIDPEV